MKTKQHKHVNYLGYVLDETILGETMALRVTEKISSRLKFLYQKKNQFLDVPLHRLLCNPLFNLTLIMPVLYGTQICQKN